MPVLSPYESATLAERAYLVQDELTVSALLNSPQFSATPNHKSTIGAKVGGRLLRASSDAFAVCAKGQGKFKDDIFLVFRGSTNANNNADWISNFRIGFEFSSTGIPVHIGFNQIFGSVVDKIRKFISENYSHKGAIHIVGHSLGGAIANLAADWAKKRYGGKVCLYTYGAPRVGGYWFARSLGNRLSSNNIHRVYHKTDPVPMLPLFPYTHAPLSNKGYQLYSSQSISSAAAHDIKVYQSSVKGAGWSGLYGPIAPFKVDHMVEQWLKSDRRPNSADPSVWEWLNSATVWVLRKVVLGGIIISQSVLIGLHSLADKLAWALKSGIDTSKDVGFWVYRLLKKIMQVLGIPVVEKIEDLTRAFMKKVLMRLLERMAYQAQIAIRKISGGP